MKNKIITITFCSILFIFSFLNIITPDKEMSYSERRKLAKFPKLEIDKILDKSFIEELEKYSLDHFVYRDSFRKLKANINCNILNKLDNNDFFVKDNYIFKREKSLNLKSITNFENKIHYITTLLNENNKVYYALVPSKNEFIDDYFYSDIDYDYIYNSLSNNLNIKEIKIKELLELDNYYMTDTHWRQEKILDVAKKLIIEMDNTYKDSSYDEIIIDDFEGIYYGQALLKKQKDKLIYLNNKTIEEANVTYLENKGLNSIYSKDKLNSFEKYDLFLDGASAYIEIENKNSSSSKELVIFRDSFGSSITPLLLDYYSKITLIDIRYISSDYYLDLIEFSDQDVLFLYSTLLVNNSETLRK